MWTDRQSHLWKGRLMREAVEDIFSGLFIPFSHIPTVVLRPNVKVCVSYIYSMSPTDKWPSVPAFPIRPTCRGIHCVKIGRNIQNCLWYTALLGRHSVAVINAKRILMSLYYRPDPLNCRLYCHLHLTLIQCGLDFDELFRKYVAVTVNASWRIPAVHIFRPYTVLLSPRIQCI